MFNLLTLELSKSFLSTEFKAMVVLVHMTASECFSWAVMTLYDIHFVSLVKV